MAVKRILNRVKDKNKIQIFNWLTTKKIKQRARDFTLPLILHPHLLNSSLRGLEFNYLLYS
jgi:hypothetical protein